MYNDYQSMAKTLTKVMTVLLPDIEKYGYDIFNKQGYGIQEKRIVI